MASRVRVAASTCLVVSGLFIAGTGGAIALADPGHGNGSDGSDGSNESSADPQDHDSLGDVIRRAMGIDSGNGQKASDPGSRPQTRLGNGRDKDDQSGGETGTKVTNSQTTQTKETTEPTDPTKTRPTEPTDTTKPTKPTDPCEEPTTPTTPPGQEPPPVGLPGGGGGGGAVIPLPRFKPPTVPGMQLPGELQAPQPGLPVGPAALDAGAGAVAVAPAAPAEPIALPVIVAPPVGLGAGAGAGPGAGPPAAPPAAPRGVAAEPMMKNIAPANAGNSAVVPASYRIGYTEYLRTAGLPQVAALAVPGLVGILVLTGAGGLVGYRQAKAGHAVRAGTARFMR